MECSHKIRLIGLALVLTLTLGMNSKSTWARLPIGEDPPGACKYEAPVPQWRPPAFVDTLADDLKQRLDPTYLRWIDANFLFEARKEKDTLKLQSVPSAIEALQQGKMFQETWDLYSQGAARNGPGLRAYLDQLRTQGRTMPAEQRLLLLSLWGDKLASGYDQTLPSGGMRVEDIFTNAQLSGSQGGVCRHIHDLVQEMAKALGFEATGQHSGNWKQSDGTVAHAVAHYRDPATGEYYMQNYSSIVNTKQKTLQDAVDVSTRILGPLSTTSAVESQPGRVHLYQPRTARWVRAQLEGRAFAQNAPLISLDLGNRTQTIGAQAQAGNVKLFGFHTNFMGGSSDTQLSAVGASWKDGFSTKIQDSVLSEVGAAVQAYGGYQRFETSKLEPDPKDHPHDWSRKNMFFGARADGYARFFDDQVTGYSKVELSSTDFDPTAIGKRISNIGSLPYNEITAGVQVGKTDSPLTIALERNW